MFIPDDQVEAPVKPLATPRKPRRASVGRSGGIPTCSPQKLQNWAASLQDPKMRGQLVRLLAKTLIFAETTEAFRSAIVDAVTPAEFKTGQVVFRHGEPGDWMGIIISGRVDRNLQRRSTDISIGDLGPGAIVGDLGLFGINTHRSFTVVALTDCMMLLLVPESFEDAIARAGGPTSLSLFRDGQTMKNLMADTDSFLNLQCFRKLDRDFVMELRENSEPRLCYPNQVLMKETYFGNEMYILRAGTVKIEKEGKFVVELPSGVVLGELAVLGSDKRRTATVTCTSLCLIRALHADVFREILDRCPSARRAFDHAYFARLVSIDVQNTKEEVLGLDTFYGSAIPKTASYMQDMLGSTSRVDEPRRRHKGLKKEGTSLPKLCAESGEPAQPLPVARSDRAPL